MFLYFLKKTFFFFFYLFLVYAVVKEVNLEIHLAQKYFPHLHCPPRVTMEPSGTKNKGGNLWSNFLLVNSNDLFHISSVPPPSLRHKGTTPGRAGWNVQSLRKSPVAKSLPFKLCLGHQELHVPLGQPLFLIPARDRSRKKDCIWPAVHSTRYHSTLVPILRYHLYMGQELPTCPVRTLNQAIVWDQCPLCSLTMWVHCKHFLMEWNPPLHWQSIYIRTKQKIK